MVCTYGHSGDDVIDALIDEANYLCGVLLNAIGEIPEHIPVCAKQSCSLASASFDHIFIDLVTGASFFKKILLAGIKRK